MAKKYSVNMENDEIISVEVDGIRYENPDEIPDRKDRERVLELISKLAEEDFTGDPDIELEEEFRELERQAAGMQKTSPGFSLLSPC